MKYIEINITKLNTEKCKQKYLCAQYKKYENKIRLKPIKIILMLGFNSKVT